MSEPIQSTLPRLFKVDGRSLTAATDILRPESEADQKPSPLPVPGNRQNMNSTATCFLLLIALSLVAAFSTTYATHPADSDSLYSSRLKKSPTPNGGGGGFFGPGGGLNVPGLGPIPGFGNGVSGGYGGGYGGPSGGYAKGGVVRPTVTCMDRGPCYKKKLRCPAKCFTSYSRSGKNYGAGGGGGGCTMDCKKKCVAYC